MTFVRYYVIFVAITLFPFQSYAQSTPPTPSPSSPQTDQRLIGVENSIRDLQNSVRDLRNSVQDFQNSVGNLRDSVKDLRDSAKQNADDIRDINWQIKAVIGGGGVFAFLITVFGISSLFQNRKRDRETAAQEISMRKMLDLYSIGEISAQKRAAELHNVMLDEGRTTLTLVNETLGLAKEASESAIKALEQRIQKQRDAVDKDARDFLVEFSDKDNRNIVNRPENRDRLSLILQKLAAFEYNNETLATPQPLSPSCQFLKALQYYLAQQFDPLIQTLRGVVSNKETEEDLRIRSWYWIGYEQNNIGDFKAAEDGFNSGIALAKGERRLMLERLRVETMLFNEKQHLAIDLIDNIDRLIDACIAADCSQDSKDLLSVTKGNILYAAALQVYDGGKGDKNRAKTYMRQAAETLKPLVAREIPAAERDYAFACAALQENLEEITTLLDNKVRTYARDQVIDRIGARHKAYHSAILMMISKFLGDETRAAAYDARVTQYVGEVHKRMLIYSPVKRRNVTRDALINEMRSIMTNGVPRII